MSDIDKITKELEAHKKAIIDDKVFEEEEEQRRKKNQELMDRFNAINDSLKINEDLLKPSAYELKMKQDQEQGKSNKLDDLDLEFKQAFAKMGDFFQSSGLFNQLQKDDQEDRDYQQKIDNDDEKDQQKTEQNQKEN